MKKKRTSSYEYAFTPLEVWKAVTNGVAEPEERAKEISEEEYLRSKEVTLNQGQYMARVTDLTPGKSCAYDLEAKNFTVHWNAIFKETDNHGCLLTVTEVYEFPKRAWFAGLMAKLFLKQDLQHQTYFQEIKKKLYGTA